MDLTDIFRTFHPKAAEYIFISTVHGTFCRIDHTWRHESALNKYKKIEIILCIFSSHHTMKFKINHKKKFGKITNIWRQKNILLKNEWANQEIKEEIRKYMQANENENTSQNLWDAEKVVIKGEHIAIQAFQKKEEKSQIHNNLTLHLKELDKEQQINPKPAE